MPMLDRPDGVIHYEVSGSGFPVLLFAPGGLRSRLELWSGPGRPWVDWTRALPAAGFTAIAMDQRNAGRSRADIRADHGWHSYAADHLALMDHLGFGRFHVLGGCIGGSFCLKIIEVAPGRVAAAVLQNPIGRHPETPDYFETAHSEWSREQLAARPELDAAALAAFGAQLWQGDFVFSVDREFAARCPVPTLLLPGSDIPHPAGTSAALARLLPGVEVLDPWRGPDHLAAQEAGVVSFLRRHTPAGG
jgi:pimeloyl-ACP methyl ester carboxylesterase